jgi:hypothetical protein
LVQLGARVLRSCDGVFNATTVLAELVVGVSAGPALVGFEDARP